MANTPTMGPIERELRAWIGFRTFNEAARGWLSLEAWTLCMGAERSLGVHGPFEWRGKTEQARREIDAVMPDVLSEAIEAAEALGL